MKAASVAQASLELLNVLFQFFSLFFFCGAEGATQGKHSTMELPSELLEGKTQITLSLAGDPWLIPVSQGCSQAVSWDPVPSPEQTGPLARTQSLESRLHLSLQITLPVIWLSLFSKQDSHS